MPNMYARYFVRRARVLLAGLMLASVALSACDSNSTPTPVSQVGLPAATATSGAQTSTGDATEVPAAIATVEPTEVAGEEASATAESTTTAAVEVPVATPTAEALAAPSSLMKISEAERAGKIDHDTALLYQLYSYFERESLPEEYLGDDSDSVVEAADVLMELSGRLDEMSGDLRAEVEPFLKRPDEAGSFWNRLVDAADAGPSEGGAGGGLNSQVALAKPKVTPTIPAGWEYLDSSDTNTRVWYPKVESGEGFAQMAGDLAHEIDTSRMWAVEKLAMVGKYEPCTDSKLLPNGGNGRLDVYLVAAGQSVPRGADAGAVTLAPDWNGLFYGPNQVLGRDCAVAGYILLNNAQDFKHLKVNMAHELFHGFQAAVTVKMGQAEYAWWKESSATWAEDLVYPMENVEQEFLARDNNSWSFQRSFGGPLNCAGRTIECNYAAYLWPFYLTRGGGGATNEYIGRVWEQSKEKLPSQIMGEMNGWADQWKKFALWNWNEGPADYYRDPDANGSEGHIGTLHQMATDVTGKGRFEAPTQPWSARGWGWPLEMAKTYAMDVNLPAASFDYFVAGKPPDKSGVLHFEFGELNKPGAGAVQAIVTIGDPDKPTIRYVEDWSNRTERKFCLDRPDEYATNVVVIVSNSDLRSGEALQGKLKVTAEAGTCPNSSNMNFSVGGSYSIHAAAQPGYGSASGSISTFEQVQSTWTMQFDGRENDDLKYKFVSTNQIDMHASSNLSGQYGDEFPTVGTFSSSLNGSSTTHNPTQQGDDGFGKKTRATLGNQYNNLPYPNAPGYLTLTKINGKDAYYMQLGITPMIPNYTSHSYLYSGCQPQTSYTHIQDYDNKAFTTVHTESGDGRCFRYQDNKQEVEVGPWVFGAVQLAINKPRGPMGSTSFIAGYYDPKSNVIEGSETYATKVCREANMLDPLVSFVGDAMTGLYTSHKGLEDEKSASCNLYYTVHWRVELPRQ